MAEALFYGAGILFAGVAVWAVLRGRHRGASTIPHAHGPGRFKVDVVGESHYQQWLGVVAGGKNEFTKNIEVTALLVLDDDNPHDPNAVRVCVAGNTVGYLSRADAPVFRAKLIKAGHHGTTVTCQALITGGWKRRGRNGEGHFGVKLDLPTAR